MSLNVPMSGYPNEPQMVWPQTGYPHPMAYPNFLGKNPYPLLCSHNLIYHLTSTDHPSRIPPPRPRPPSRNTSRAASPALSQKSRRSVASRVRSMRYIDNEETDDEASGGELVHPRPRRMSTQSNLENKGTLTDSAFAATQPRRFKKSKDRRERAGSVARSMHEFPITPLQVAAPKGAKSMTSDSVFSSELDSEEAFREPKLAKVLPTAKSEPKINGIKHTVPMTATPRLAVPEDDSVIEEGAVGGVVEGAVGGIPNAPLPKVDSATLTKQPPVLTTISPGVAVGGAIKKIPVKAEDDDKKWICEHCTFINEADAKMCNICFKTPWTLNSRETVESPTIDISEPTKDDNQNKGTKQKKISFDVGTKD